ncbi:hypothetical protein ATCV1_z318R [Acanthocystis turfacea chlorella virus 1]|uniref:Uncharacterized protein z318R n=1 Tax=Chlorovirus heliozoae TaxID=322019 RepID=A7K8S8_9PHYC|nr:hypothetical protein ATCV1_z318R [Acanthocystis turfacea chlorella virus 1]ABT16452.1 hypothetical protein ATCV1_z318R [Acanthocystis turfacea chlorella virus 1]
MCASPSYGVPWRPPFASSSPPRTSCAPTLAVPLMRTVSRPTRSTRKRLTCPPHPRRQSRARKAPKAQNRKLSSARQ